jgi:NAD(P)-dependent dehydrogenase (short-subunit alcohol dehydrogenase family)
VVAAELARGGADIAIVYHSSQGEADRAAEAVKSLGRRAVVLKANLREAPECDRVVADAVTALGRLDVLVNLASVYRPRPFDETTLEDWNAAIEVDLRASYLCARAAVPEMRRLRGGRIVNFSDWLAQSGRPRYPGYLPYYVAKAAVSALTEALALELAADQILVNAIAPGPILAPPGTSAAESAAVERATPLGRWGGEAEIAKAVLAIVASDFMTGETIRVDGGRHLK